MTLIVLSVKEPNRPAAVFRQRLLPTSPTAIPPEAADSLHDFCESAGEIEAGYVCLAGIEREGTARLDKLQFAIKLRRPSANPEEMGNAPLLFRRRLAASHPDLLRDFGLTLLADRALAAWAKHGVRVFP